MSSSPIPVPVTVAQGAITNRITSPALTEIVISQTSERNTDQIVSETANVPIKTLTRTLKTGLKIHVDLVNQILAMSHTDQIDMLVWHQEVVKFIPKPGRGAAELDREELIGVLCAILQVRRDFMVVTAVAEKIGGDWHEKAKSALLGALQGGFGRLVDHMLGDGELG